MISSLEILHKYWGHSSFRNPQEEIINAVLSKKNTLALLPTGGGKSICYQIPALQLDGICIVISPLIALMQDQVNQLINKGIKATTIASGLSKDEIVTLFDNLKYGNYKFLYLSPERLQSKFIQQKIQELKVNLIAVDEAHCISEWGHDFRPAYRNITVLKELHPETNVIAVTATATEKVIHDIKESLDLKEVSVYKKSFSRENLAYQVFTVQDKLFKLKQIFTKTKKPAIVYVNSRNKTKEIAAYLNANGFKSSFYHGGLPILEKEKAFTNWLEEKTPIMVATNAFGMGIDKANIGVVIHLHIPNSLENYVQEAGRAGRDNKKAFAVSLINKADTTLFSKQLTESLPAIEEIKEVYKKLNQNFQIAYGEFHENSLEFNLLEFCKKYNLTPNKVNSILKILINNGIIELDDSYNSRSTLQFICTNSQLLNYTKHNSQLQKAVNIILRSYGGVFEQEVKIDEYRLAKKISITSTQLITKLKRLAKDEIITYNKANANSELYFLVPREDDKTINRISKNAIQFINQKKAKAEASLSFAKNDEVCRSIQLLSYFGEYNSKKCNICDVCLSQKKNKVINVQESILTLLKEKTALDSREIVLTINALEKDILINLRSLLEEEKIALNQYNKYYIKY